MNTITIRPLNYLSLKKLSEEGIIDHLNLSKFELTKGQDIAIKKKLLKMERVDVTMHDWYTYWVICYDDFAAGLIGYKGLTEEHSAEVGYGTSKGFEGKGITKEALKLITKWAFTHDTCKKITACHVLIDNIGSQKVLEHNQFKLVSKDEQYYHYEKTNSYR